VYAAGSPALEGYSRRAGGVTLQLTHQIAKGSHMVRMYLLVAVVGAVVLILLLRSAARADPARVASLVRWSAAGLGTVALLLLAVSGRLQALALLVAALLPLLVRTAAAWQRAKAAAGPSHGKHSQVQTRWLRMSLDHGSGAMEGEVLEGRFRGRSLGELKLDQLLELLQECRLHDAQGAGLLEAYLDRLHGEHWRETSRGAGGGWRRGSRKGPAMSREEAYQILGLQPGATAEQIRDAHRRLMQKFHPDRDGSTYLAAQINRAKDLLLGKAHA
jgi:DnaJ domain